MTYTFGDYSLDPARRELRRSHKVVPVEPQVFDILECEDPMFWRTVFCAVLVSSTYVGSLQASGAAEFGTAEEAKAMLERAISEVKANKLSAIDKFNHNDWPFRDRDLFVFCFNANDGRFTAHEALVAQDVRNLRYRR